MNLQMVGDLKCRRSRPYYFRRCKKQRPTTTCINSLPDELLFSILVCLPADYLHDIARLVCRRWYDIIHSQSFINAHFQHSTHCLLLSYNPDRAVRAVRPVWAMTATSQGLIQTNEVSYRLRDWLLGTCNGLMLMLVSCRKNTIILQIINPATKQSLCLPPFTVPNLLYIPKCGIAYAAASMKYKVAISYVTMSHFLLSSAPPLSPGLAILSVGVDTSWRQVQVDQYLSEQQARKLIFNGPPLLTEGFMHWVHIHSGETFVTLDVETEILTMSELPSPPKKDEECSKLMFYLSTRRSLSLLIGRREDYRFFELWEMNPETKEWMMLVDDIKLGDKEQQLRLQQLGIRPREGLRPLGWIKYPEVLVLSVNDYSADTRAVISYNLDTHEINFFDFRPFRKCTHAMYKNSLLWLT